MIPKSGPEIKNRCTQEGVNEENRASIRKSKPEIKNRCTQQRINGEILASIPKSGLEIQVSVSAITCPRYKKSRVCALLFFSPFVWEEVPVCFRFGAGRQSGCSIEYIRQVVEEVDAHLTA